MSDQLPAPLTDEQAKALQEVAKLLGKPVEALVDAVRFLGSLIGEPLRDIAGLAGADALRAKRIENLVRLREKTMATLSARGVEEPQSIPLTLAVPLLNAAADESRDELLEVWSKIVAAAADPARAGNVRLGFVEVVKKFDPLDALVLQQLGNPGELQPSARDVLASRFQVSADAVELSLFHLVELGCARDPASPPGHLPTALQDVALTVLGRELLRVVAR